MPAVCANKTRYKRYSIRVANHFRELEMGKTAIRRRSDSHGTIQRHSSARSAGRCERFETVINDGRAVSIRNHITTMVLQLHQWNISSLQMQKQLRSYNATCLMRSIPVSCEVQYKCDCSDCGFYHRTSREWTWNVNGRVPRVKIDSVSEGHYFTLHEKANSQI